jgi:AAA+ ATPase superfamily predicted ATPase
MWPKPSDMHDRDHEWARLTEFVTSPGKGTRLGIVYGRRRQGKTTLLEELCRVAGGFYWQAREQESAQNLASLEEAWSAYRGTGGPSRFASWGEALSTLATVGRGSARSVPVVIDEVGYLLARNPALASELQAVLSPRGLASREGGTRLILCGSALGQMRRLLDPDAPLRGRAGIELVVQPFDYRTSASFWGLAANADAAFRLHALIGGTPAYVDLAGGYRPTDGDVDRWTIERLLDPASALFREGRLAVSEDPQLRDGQLYWGMLSAIAGGANRWAELSAALGGQQGTMSHALDVLVDAGWIERHADPLRGRRSWFEITEPVVRFSQLVVEQFGGRLRRPGSASSVWDDARPIVRSLIYAPHLETLARSWVRDFASPESVDGVADHVEPSDVAGVGQLDLVAVERGTKGGQRVIAVGEVKSGIEPVGIGELDRLDDAIAKLGTARSVAIRRLMVGHPKRILVARAGFTVELRRAVKRRGDVELVDLARLYGGD